MLAQSLINVAILACFSVSSGQGINFDLHAGKEAAAKVEEKVVLRENLLSEKLGLESAAQPDREIVALQSSVSGLPSALSLDEKIVKQTPEKLPFASRWNDKFIVTWDEDGGFCFERRYHPAPDPTSPYPIMNGFFAGFSH